MTIQEAKTGRPARIVSIGEVLWDIFGESARLGGAPLNFAAHATRLGHESLFISALGEDELGRDAREAVTALGISTRFVQTTNRFGTGTALVELGPAGRTIFTITRPAAYDAVKISPADLDFLIGWHPEWLYFGTLFASAEEGRATLLHLLRALPDAGRFYDLNLRPGFDDPALVSELLRCATVVKLNDTELDVVHEFTGLPLQLEDFCHVGAARYGWKAACVTLGARGCAMLSGKEYVEAGGYAVEVADTVGAGDAFGAAFLHGIVQAWTVKETAAFANRIGALVASRPGAIPDWSITEAVNLGH